MNDSSINRKEKAGLVALLAMAAILGVILKLPPVKQIMASRQMKSRYLDRLLAARSFVHRDS